MEAFLSWITTPDYIGHEMFTGLKYFNYLLKTESFSLLWPNQWDKKRKKFSKTHIHWFNRLSWIFLYANYSCILYQYLFSQPYKNEKWWPQKTVHCLHFGFAVYTSLGVTVHCHTMLANHSLVNLTNVMVDFERSNSGAQFSVSQCYPVNRFSYLFFKNLLFLDVVKFLTNKKNLPDQSRARNLHIMSLIVLLGMPTLFFGPLVTNWGLFHKTIYS